jgi:hypothetical protein
MFQGGHLLALLHKMARDAAHLNAWREEEAVRTKTDGSVLVLGIPVGIM